ncbi:MAG: GNAT family N-acetyltransferase [Clostridiales bacterium]|nr:GNAT family N-acetyltransferase [Clostridiales bacterium]
MIRKALPSDLNALLQLYTHLKEEPTPPVSDDLLAVWQSIMDDPKHHIIVAEVDETIVSSCVINIIPNLTHHYRPYALIENVVTHKDYRGSGYATRCLDYAKEIANAHNCYKIMLLTGSKDEKVLNFYRHAGYVNGDKTGFIQWL